MSNQNKVFFNCKSFPIAGLIVGTGILAALVGCKGKEGKSGESGLGTGGATLTSVSASCVNSEVVFSAQIINTTQETLLLGGTLECEIEWSNTSDSFCDISGSLNLQQIIFPIGTTTLNNQTVGLGCNSCPTGESVVLIGCEGIVNTLPTSPTPGLTYTLSGLFN